MKNKSISNYPALGSPLVVVGRLACWAGLVLVFFSAPQTAAIERTWNSETGGNWSEPMNWSPAGAPTSGDVLVFPKSTPAGKARPMINDLAALTFGGLAFADHGFTVGGNPIHLGGSGIVATQFIGSAEINCNLVLHANQTFTANHSIEFPPFSSCLLLINGDISGVTMWNRLKPDLILHAGPPFPTPGPDYPPKVSSIILGGQLSDLRSLTINGQYGATLRGANSGFNGTILVDAGPLRIENELALGTTTWGTTVNNGAMLELAFSGSDVDVNEPLTLNDGSTLQVRSPSVDWNGPITTLGGTLDCLTGTALWVNGIISGAGGITKTGPGDLYLMAANSYDGLTVLNKGTVYVGNAGALGSAAQGTTINSSAVLSLGSYSPDLPRAIDVPGEALRFSGTDSTLRYYAGMAWRGPVTVDADCTGIVWGSRCSDYPYQDSWMEISGPIDGTGNMIFLAENPLLGVTLNGIEPNTLSGVTAVAGGVLKLGKPSGTYAVSGPLEVNIHAYGSEVPAQVSILADGQLRGPWIAVYDHGQVKLNGHWADTGELFMRGGDVYLGPNGELILQGRIIADEAPPGMGDHSSGVIDPYGEGVVWVGVGMFGEITVPSPNCYLTIGARINNDGEVYGKTGEGRLILTGNINQAYCWLNQGTLEVNGDQPSSSIRVGPSSGLWTINTLRGSGRVGTVEAVGGYVRPGGYRVGRFTVGPLTLGSQATFYVRLNGSVAGTDYDQLRVNGTANLGSALLRVDAGFAPTVGQSFIIIDKGGMDPIVGTFAGLPEGAQVLSSEFILPFRISYYGGDGNDVVLTRVAGPPYGSVRFGTSAYTVAENSGTVRVLLTRTGGASGPASVQYATANGTATAGVDYVAAAGTLNWADGEMGLKYVDVTILDDSVYETDETFTMVLSGASGAALGSPATTTVTIQDNDQTSCVPVNFVTGMTLMSPQNGYTRWLGMRLRVGASPMPVQALGRIYINGNVQNHELRLVEVATKATVASVVWTPGGTAGQIKYAALATPVVLAPNTEYDLASQEFLNGDKWYHYSTTVTTTSDASVLSAVFSNDGTAWTPYSTAGHTYGPVSFQYCRLSTVETVSVPTAVSGPASTFVGKTEAYAASGASSSQGHTLQYRFDWGDATISAWGDSSQSHSWSGSGTFNIKAQARCATDTGVESAWSGTLQSVAVGYCTLTTTVSPSGSGSVTRTPDKTGYNWNESVSLTAAANSGYTFSSWSGDASGTVSPTSVTMSGNKAVTANFAGPGCVPVSFVTGMSLTTAQNGYDRWLGMRLQVGASPLQVTALGRMYIQGNSQSHELRLVNVATKATVASVVWTPGGTAGQIRYATLAGPVTLAANTAYDLASREYAAGDQWYHYSTTVTTTTDASVLSAVFSGDGTTWTPYSTAGHTYGPVSFQYCAGQPGTTSYTIALPPGTSAIANHLDRGGNTLAEVLPTVPDGTVLYKWNCLSWDVYTYDAFLGGWVDAGNVTLAPGEGAYLNNPTAGQLSITFRGTEREPILPLPLPCGTGYNLVGSQRVEAADYESILGIPPTEGAEVRRWNPVTQALDVYTYSSGAWLPSEPIANIGESVWVRVPAVVMVTVGTSPAGRSFSVDGTTYAATQTFSWVPGSTHTLATTSPQSGGTGVQYVWSSWSDGGTISHSVVAPSSSTTYTANFQTQYYLTMSAGAGGTVSPVSGWRDAGTSVSISASASSGYGFAGWTGSGSGAYSGMNNPVNVTMNGPISEAAAFTAPGCVPVNFVTGMTLLSPQNGYTRWLGMRLQVGASPLQVSALGRIYIAGNSQSHELRLVNVATKATVASVVWTPGGTAGQIKYATLGSPVTLAANTAYDLASQEYAGGDQWYHYSTTVTTTTDASVLSAVFSGDGTTWTPYSTAGHTYGPVSFQYCGGTAVEVVSVPTAVSGPSSTFVGKSESYTASGAASSQGHTLQYRFDWGDGTISAWGSASQSYSWSGSGTFNIKAQARCATDTAVVSAWSGPLRSVAVSFCTLTMSVSPSSAGTVSKSPNKTGYNWNESVTMTAVANSGYSFSSWSGDLSGTANPTTLTMSGNKAVTANFTAGCVPVNFVTGMTLVSPQNGYDRWLGMRLQVGASPLQVSALGRMYIQGNSQSHELRLVQVSSGATVASVVWTPGGTAGQIRYATLGSPVTLAANTAYDLASREYAAGDQWYHHNTTVTTTTAASVLSAVFSDTGTTWTPYNTAGHTYGPVSFQYCGGAGPAAAAGLLAEQNTEPIAETASAEMPNTSTVAREDLLAVLTSAGSGASMVDGYVVLEYLRTLPRPAVDYVVEASDNMVNWISTEGLIEETVEPVDQGTEYVRVRYLTPVEQTQVRYLRLRVVPRAN